MIALQRHALLAVEAAAWREQAGNHEIPEVRDWIAKGWPLICRRPMPGETGGVALGLPLPPSLGKQRLRFNVMAQQVRPYSGTTLLSEYADCPALGEYRRQDVRALVAIGKEFGLMPKIAGSLLWEGITGLPYLSERSDLDVLWPIVRQDLDLIGLLEALQQHEAACSMPLDGEVIFPGGYGVQWRELLGAVSAGGDPMVITKSLGDVALMPVSALVARLDKAVCHA